MTELAVGQFEMDGYKFGSELDPIVIPNNGFDSGQNDWRHQDSPSPSDDTTWTGRDLLTAPSWLFDLWTNKDSAGTSLDELSVMAGKWLNAPSRHTPGALSVMRYNLGGGTRRVYGRPRRFSQSVTLATFQGVSNAVADFKLADPLSYDDKESSLQLSLVARSVGGFKAPFKAPIRTAWTTGSRQGVVTVGGSADIPFTVTFVGPIKDPAIRGNGWGIGLKGSIPLGGMVQINTRNQTVIDQNGISRPSMLTPWSRLDARMTPGAQEVSFTGEDSTNRSYCYISWRGARWSL